MTHATGHFKESDKNGVTFPKLLKSSVWTHNGQLGLKKPGACRKKNAFMCLTALSVSGLLFFFYVVTPATAERGQCIITHHCLSFPQGICDSAPNFTGFFRFFGEG